MLVIPTTSPPRMRKARISASRLVARPFDADVGAGGMQLEPKLSTDFDESGPDHRAIGLGDVDVDHSPLPVVKEREGASLGEVEELIDDDEIPRPHRLVDRSDRGRGQDPLDAQSSQAPDVGPVVDLVRRDRMAFAVAGRNATSTPRYVPVSTSMEPNGVSTCLRPSPSNNSGSYTPVPPIIAYSTSHTPLAQESLKKSKPRLWGLGFRVLALLLFPGKFPAENSHKSKESTHVSRIILRSRVCWALVRTRPILVSDQPFRPTKGGLTMQTQVPYRAASPTFTLLGPV